jgi:hypothetical protein
MNEKKGDVKIPLEQIPIDGALGLLALGDVGVKLWRDAKKKKMEEMQNNKTGKDEQKES